MLQIVAYSLHGAAKTQAVMLQCLPRLSENGPQRCQIRAVITLPCKATISGLSLSVASAHKQRGGESGAVGGQEVVFRGQHYLRRVQTMRSDVVVVVLFFPSSKNGWGRRRDTFSDRPIWTSHRLLLIHTHVERLAVCIQGTFNLLRTSASNTLRSLMVFI